jgi:hypothetical protein
MKGIRIFDNVVEIELNCDTAVHAANDVVCQPTELPLITNDNGCAVVTSIVLADYDDQGAALDLVFLSQPVTVGANNATMAIPDTQIQHVIGHLPIAAGDYINLDQNQVATLTNCGLILRADPSRANSVWVAVRTTGTPTYASGRLNLRVGVLRG